MVPEDSEDSDSDISETGSHQSKRSSISCVLDCSYTSNPESVEGMEQRGPILDSPDFSSPNSVNDIVVRSISIIGLEIGVAEVEFVSNDDVSQSLPFLVLPDMASVQEVQKIVAANVQNKNWAKAFMRDVGLVLRHLYHHDIEGSQIRIVNDAAMKTVSYCLENNCPALARLLQPAMQEQAANCPSSQVLADCYVDMAAWKQDNSVWKKDGAEFEKAHKGIDGSGSYIAAIEAERSKVLREEIQILQRETNYTWSDGGWKIITGQLLWGVTTLAIALIVSQLYGE